MIGLVHSIHPIATLKSAAMELALELAEKPPLAMAGALRCIVGAGEQPLQEALAVERREFLRCAASKDLAEGMQAFIGKREPVFTGS